MEQKVLEFLKSKHPKLCSISTVNSQRKPESALMAYAILNESDLSLLLSTRTNTRKWSNLKKNPHVSLVFGSGFHEATIQFEGMVELIDTPESISSYQDTYFSQNPETLQFKGLPELCFLKIKPTWIRYTNYIVNPPDVEEKAFEIIE